MKLRNKKTGEIIDGGFVLTYYDGIAGNPQHSLAELNEEWEDYKEPKEYWTIDCGIPIKYTWNGEKHDLAAEAVGLKFDTGEECKRAIEKLKAWKRLKDKGFRFEGYDNISSISRWRFETIDSSAYELQKDLDLLFSGEED